MMRGVGIVAALAMLLLAAGVQAAGKGAGKEIHLEPVSKTAMSITGKVVLSSSSLVFGNGQKLAVKSVAKKDVFKSDIDGELPAEIYKVMKPSDPKLLNNNYWCGGLKPQPVTYVAVWHSTSDGSTWLAPSAAAKKPSGVNGTCGTFNYALAADAKK